MTKCFKRHVLLEFLIESIMFSICADNIGENRFKEHKQQSKDMIQTVCISTVLVSVLLAFITFLCYSSGLDFKDFEIGAIELFEFWSKFYFTWCIIVHFYFIKHFQYFFPAGVEIFILIIFIIDQILSFWLSDGKSKKNYWIFQEI